MIKVIDAYGGGYHVNANGKIVRRGKKAVTFKTLDAANAYAATLNDVVPKPSFTASCRTRPVIHQGRGGRFAQ